MKLFGKDDGALSNDKIYDVAVIGGGPAGLSAALYSARALLSTLVLELGLPGGQAFNTDAIANYPGFPGEVTGPELMEKMEKQTRSFGAEFVTAEINALAPDNNIWLCRAGDNVYRSKTVIVAAGANPRRLGAPGESEFAGAGVSYCATCDGAFYRDKEIIVVGGGDAALQEAIFLTRFASRVTVVHRRDELRATKVIQQKAFRNEKISFRWSSVVERIQGGNKVEAVVLKNVKDGTLTTQQTDGVFIYVGTRPNSEFLPAEIERNQQGYLITDDAMRTTLPGVFAAGDIRQKLLRQIVTAVSDGATAAVAANEYIGNL